MTFSPLPTPGSLWCIVAIIYDNSNIIFDFQNSKRMVLMLPFAIGYSQLLVSMTPDCPECE